MSTRSMIAVKGNEDVKIYKHSDGYPEGVIPLILPILQDFIQYRVLDPQYCTARILMHIGKEEEKEKQQILSGEHEMSDMLKDIYEKPQVTGYMTGYRLQTYFQDDIKYFYLVDLEKKVIEVYVPTEESFMKNITWDTLELFKKVDIATGE